MKNFITLFISFCVFAAFSIVVSSPLKSQTAVTPTAVYTPVAPSPANGDNMSVKATAQVEVTQAETETTTMASFFKRNWGKILIALSGFTEIITRVVPTVADNSIFNLIKKVLDAIIPNNRINGGVF